MNINLVKTKYPFLTEHDLHISFIAQSKGVHRRQHPCRELTLLPSHSIYCNKSIVRHKYFIQANIQLHQHSAVLSLGPHNYLIKFMIVIFFINYT